MTISVSLHGILGFSVSPIRFFVLVLFCIAGAPARREG